MATRLYVGGLGERVKEEDLRNTFSHLGSIETIDIIRTKGRSFAYINFLPSSENSLAKLFSTYIGCLWKGGKLKLEKAKEHYIDRLKQEWAEDAELVNSENINSNLNDLDENVAGSLEPKSTLDSEKMQIRMFFPKLRKVKALPFRGTGKHKYSFQRVVVPPLPVHFCDCPEHYVDIQSDKMNDRDIINSVMNKLLYKGTSLKSGCVQPLRGIQVHDTIIQDDGLNEEEINVMNSVMKKLLDRESAKTERRDRHSTPQIAAPTVESQEDNNEIDEETDDDDDDIKINTGAGQDFGSESWELQTSLLNKMARSNENSIEPSKSKFGTQIIKEKLSKRKSVSNESNKMDPASPIHGKKARFQTQIMDSEEHSELISVTGSNTNKTITSGMPTQKASWKKLVGEGSSRSFYWSATPGGETKIDEQPISGGETSTDRKKHKRNNDVVNEEHKPSNTIFSVNKELERVSNSVPENVDDETNIDEQPTSGGETSTDSNKHKRDIDVVNDEHKPSNITLSINKELERISNAVPENKDGLSSQSKEAIEGRQAAQLAGASSSLNIATRGSTWLQKSSWSQLVGGGKSSSFSISQILPKDLLEKQQLNKPNNNGTSNNFFSSVTAFGGNRRSRSGVAGEDKKKEAQESAARGSHSSITPKGNDCSDSTTAKKSDSEQKVSNPRPGVRISETCPFMSSADSLKDWQTAKTTLTSSHKKRNNNKQDFA
ncbi:uncharacterized protein LOC110728397 [Chenopodium quinoa]|uniref:RRM domain-containing protein n=1 Tax=Chenopodium quinoa TaxID=63459 RepID=A0A803N1Z5_CHEQI|nr:uncharacterized protein LOC110728397 [Chenopodium quinoa]